MATPTPLTPTLAAPPKPPTPPAPRKRKRNILLYGRSRAGKTALIGEMAEWVKKTEGKKTRLATADRGGIETIMPYVDLGLIELVELGDDDPWIWLTKVVRGYVKDTNGRWVDGKRDDIGLYAFESLTSVADALMLSMAKKAAAGVNIGGGANVAFTVSADNESVKVSGNNMAHYGVAQSRVVEECWESQKLPGWLIWTASVSKDDDVNSSGKVLGPAVAGKALTAEVPRWFQYTFRVDAIPAQMGQKERHILYLGNQQDIGAGGATGLGNTRTPLDAPELPTTIEPASLVKALELIQAGYAPAVAAIKKRLGM